MLDPWLVSLLWLHTPMVRLSPLMSQLWSLPVLITLLPRGPLSMLLWHLGLDQLAQLPVLVQLPMRLAMLALPQLVP